MIKKKLFFQFQVCSFDRMLDQNMKEAQMGEVDILDVNPDTFKQMLEFIYTGQVTIHTFSKSLN